MSVRRSCALAALLAAFAGCGPSAEQTEARRMLGDLERLRDASDADRLATLVELERARATGSHAERARELCTEAYRALHESTTLEASVRERLRGLSAPGATAVTSAAASALPRPPAPPSDEADAGAGQPLGADTLRIVDDLGRAERALDRAKERMPECERALAALRLLARGTTPR